MTWFVCWHKANIRDLIVAMEKKKPRDRLTLSPFVTRTYNLALSEYNQGKIVLSTSIKTIRKQAEPLLWDMLYHTRNQKKNACSCTISLMWLEGRETRKPPIKNESALSFFKVITYTMKKKLLPRDSTSLLLPAFVQRIYCCFCYNGTICLYDALGPSWGIGKLILLLLQDIDW